MQQKFILLKYSYPYLTVAFSLKPVCDVATGPEPKLLDSF
jgi:hypothetical protein